MKKHFSKALALFLALVMVLSVFPVMGLAVEEGTHRDAVTQSAPSFAFVAIGITVTVLHTIHMVLLKAQESTIGWIVEIAFPSIASVGLPSNPQIEPVLGQHFHISVPRLKGEVFPQAEIGLIKGARVGP